MNETETNRNTVQVIRPKATQRILWIVVPLTVFWLAGSLTLAFCSFPNLDPPNKLNEWGDFAAGAFAPLAFLWLVVAVVLQSSELREQREELRLTRQEF